MKFLTAAILASFAWCDMAGAHEIYLDATCKQGTCIHTALNNFDVPNIQKNGALMRYESAFVEVRCKPEESMDNADCRTKHPQPSQFKNFTRSFAFCSLQAPTVVSTITSPEGKVVFVATFLNPAGITPAYQEAWVREYFVVCHNWEPRSFDDKTAGSFGYKPVSIADENKTFQSEAEVAAYLRQTLAGGLPEASLKSLQGKWYSDDQALCKREIGEAEDLFAVRGSKLLLYETDCTIRSTKTNERTLQLDLSCASEGEQFRRREQVEFLNARQIRRTMTEKGKRYAFTHTRCP